MLDFTSNDPVVMDILERRIVMGQSIDEIAEEYSYLSTSEINNIIADAEQ